MLGRRQLIAMVLLGGLIGTMGGGPGGAIVLFAADNRPATLVGPPLSDREKVLQCMNRLAFGARPGEVDEILKNGGWQAWIKAQVQNPDSIDDAACIAEISRRYPWTTKENIREFRKFVPDSRQGNREYESLAGRLPECVLMRSVLSKRQFKEMACEFWRNHFCVDLGEDNKTREWTAGHYEEQVIRKHAFGKFRNMLLASASHPAMLEYLDNQVSRANAWNENYAREVMELHTVGADRNYTNQDVLELSKILTGWQFDTVTFEFRFDESKHQPGNKRWLGKNVAPGFDAGVQCLTALANSKECSEFLSLKLCRYFINDNPPPNLVQKVAAVWRSSDGDLPKVYWAIVNSPEFMSRENFRAKFKTPFEFMASTLRATDAKIENLTSPCKTLKKMNQPIYECPDPTGYRFVAESWMDAGVLTSRWDFAWRLIRGGVNGVTVPESFLTHFDATDPDLLQKMADQVVGGDIGDKEKKTTGEPPRMLSILLGSPSFQQK